MAGTRDPRTYGRFRGRPMSREAAEAILAAEGGLPVPVKAPKATPKTTPRRRPLVPLVPRNVESSSTTKAAKAKLAAPKPRPIVREEDEVDG